jgi:hypothetical protein
MNKQLEEILQKKYPILFKGKDLPLTQSLMPFGCECGDGWFKILDHLFGYLTDLMERNFHLHYTEEYKNKHRNDPDYYEKHMDYKFKPPQIILDQVKEKYGTLRVYYHVDLEKEIPEDVYAILDLNDYNKKFSSYYDKIDNAIDYAEYQSSITCEITGKEGKLYTKGWYCVLCDEEAIKKGYDPSEGVGFKYENF